MKYKIYIPHTNKIEMIRECLSHLSDDISKNIILIDNSKEKDLDEFKDKYKILETPIQLNTAQTYNFMRKHAIENVDMLFFMHDDCMVHDDINGFIEKSLKTMRSDSSVGCVYVDDGEEYTCKDLLCCYRCGMLEDIGEWDALSFPFYYLDLDFFNRIELNNWLISPTNLNIEHKNGGSNTLKNDIERQIVNGYYLEVSKTLFETKWET